MRDSGATLETKLQVFISYSRRDLEFADQLAAVLEFQGYPPIIDREGIHGAEQWERRLGQLILEADVVVFVLSPDSAASEVCAWEVEEAARRGKRIIPLLCRPLEGHAPHPRLRDLNYIHFYPEKDVPGSGFGTGSVRLVQALSVDILWLREHTRLEGLAQRWQSSGNPVDQLLRGSELSDYKNWRDQRPANAPDLTQLQRTFLATGEEEEQNRISAERKRLDEMAAANAERAKALETAESAIQARAKVQTRLVGSIAIGLLAALALAGVASYAAWGARQGRLEAEAQKRVAEEQRRFADDQKREIERSGSQLAQANRRLGTEMKLRVAPFGTSAYTIPEQWYKLATTNAASIAFIESQTEKWRYVGSGILAKASQLHPEWDDALVILTAHHVAAEQKLNIEGARKLRVHFPAVSTSHRVTVKSFLWASTTDGSLDDLSHVDTAVLRLTEPAPPGVRAIDNFSDLDISGWPAVKLVAGVVEKSVLESAMPLIVLGGSLDGVHAIRKRLNDSFLNPSLTLSLANALGRHTPRGNDRVILTDSTTGGSSGSAVFDARDGGLIGIIQIGSDPGARPKTGLAYSGGTTSRKIRDAIAESRTKPIEWARWLLLDGKLDEANRILEAAVVRNTASRSHVSELYVEHLRDLLVDYEREAASTITRYALAINPDAKADFAGSYVRGAVNLLRKDKASEANELFAQALSIDPDASMGAAQALVEYGVELLAHDDAWNDALSNFNWAMKINPAVARSIAEAIIDRTSAKLMRTIMSQDNPTRVGTLGLANDLFKMALAYHPGGTGKVGRAYVRYGIDLLSAGDEASANAIFEMALTFDTGAAAEIEEARADHEVALGGKLLNEGKGDEAEAIFARALSRMDNQSRGRLNGKIAAHRIDHIVSLLDAGHEDKAITLIQHHPQTSDNTEIRQAWTRRYIARGLALVKGGKSQKAHQAFEQAIKNEDNGRNTLAGALISHAAWLLEQEQQLEAKRVFEAAISYGSSKSAASIHLKYARALLGREQDRLAKEHFETALRLDSALRHEVALAYVDHASHLLSSAKEEAAKKNVMLAMAYDSGVSPRIDLTLGRHHVRRGIELLRSGNENEARQLFAHARELGKVIERNGLYGRDWGQVFRDIATAWHQAGKSSEGITDAERAVELDGVRNRLLLGEILFAIGRISDAVLEFDEFLEDRFDAAEAGIAYLARGRCFELLGERDAAILDYRAAITLERSPAFFVKTARERLAALGASEGGDVRPRPLSGMR